MYELQLKHGEAILDRLVRQSADGNDGVPAHVGVNDDELKGWYGSVANVIAAEAGKKSELPKRWAEGFRSGCRAKDSWLNSHQSDYVGSHVAYMRSMLSTLTDLNSEYESRRLWLPDKVTVPWLLKSVGWTFWSGALAVLLGTFLAGTQAIRLNFVREALSLPTCTQVTPTPTVLRK